MLKERAHLKDEMPSRSRLYHLDPQETETPQYIESLTSYINRLAWAYRINPRQLLTQEIIPHLRGSYRFPHRQLASFVRNVAMSINGIGGVAIDWTNTLEQLTLRSDLRYLNVQLWASELPTRGLLRATPAWCPLCYQDWLNNGVPIYQPLLWMLQVVTICLKHRHHLETQCLHCQNSQTVIASSTIPIGYCTRCNNWLGVSSTTIVSEGIDEGTFLWQKYVMTSFKELHGASTTSGMLSWGNLKSNLSICRSAMKGAQKLSDITAIPKITLESWISGKIMPSFIGLLKFCYTLGLSPLLLLTGSSVTLLGVLQTKRTYQLPPLNRTTPLLKQDDNILEFIHAVFEGREAPHSMAQVGRRFGRSSNYITHHYPQDAALLVANYRTHRSEQARKRLERITTQVRTATFSLHAQGIFPSQRRVSSILSDPNWMFMPETREAWHAARHELGLE